MNDLVAPEGFAPRPSDDSFNDTMGPVFVSTSGPPWRMGLWATAKHQNPHGMLDGGLIMALADHAIGFNIFQSVAGGTSFATIGLNVDFVAGGRLGEWIEAVPEIVRKTRTLAFAKARVTADGRLIATASGVWKFVETRTVGG
ncbi:MAG: PaaI family thioesterase [Proteobacteria bacterium]|nr:PaaI family thioesterase [Pseudomonadota bacterium]MDA1060076.1 PaaI family thioesterase [Pseudomonadota bacterium]